MPMMGGGPASSMPVMQPGGAGGLAPPFMAMSQSGGAAAPPEMMPDGMAQQYPAGPIVDEGMEGMGQPVDQSPCCEQDPSQIEEGYWCPPVADKCPLFGLYSFTEMATWRGITTGDLPNNNGFTQGLNAGIPLPWLGEFGFGAQLGGSWSVYDLEGRRSAFAPNRSNQQTFMTGGFYRRADAGRRVSMGAVYDIMWNEAFGALAANPTLTQFRFQVAYALGYWNELGVWTSLRDHSSYNTVIVQQGAGTATAFFNPMNQVSLFWHHKWGMGGADSWLYVGATPDRRQLSDPLFGGVADLGEFLVGGTFNAPVTDKIALYGNFTYMKPSTNAAQPFASIQDSWYVGFGLQFYPGASARSSTVAGRMSTPYMPVANNGSFLVNTNRTF
jgi:hypothetical protein